MPEPAKRKVGLVSCSGEELPEGTITRLATLKVLESLHPEDTVTICLPLFLAGGEGDRAFARFYPTIAVDGCDKRCAARGTEMYSGKPAASIVVSELLGDGQEPLGTARRLSGDGMRAVDAVAAEMVRQVNAILGTESGRRSGDEVPGPVAATLEPVVATCSCGSGIPIQAIVIDGREVRVVALPLIFGRFRGDGRTSGPGTTADLIEAVRIYNPIPPGDEAPWGRAIAREYDTFCREGR
jgi:hypothetical protein